MKEENKKSDHLKYVRLLYAEIEENRNYNFYTFEVVTTGKLEYVRKDLKNIHKVNIYYMYNNNLNSKVNIYKLDNFIREYDKD